MLRERETTGLAARVAQALAAGELGVADLTARQLGAFVGKTSSLIYRRFGSLDGFLHEVAQEGFRALTSQLEQVGASRNLGDVAAGFVAFGLDRPALYYVMFEHRYDWEALRRSQSLSEITAGLALWRRIVAELEAVGSAAPETDARLLYAGLHGLVSLAAAGRANIGDIATSDRDIALASARALAHRLCPHAGP